MAVYFIRAEATGAIKIGYAANVGHRRAQIAMYSPEPIKVIATIPDGTRTQEEELHERFAQDRIRGEWFHPSPALMAFIDAQEPYLIVPRTRPPRRPKAERPPAPKPFFKLSDWRKAKGWTRKEAAAHLGINARTLESWECGARRPPALNVLEHLVLNTKRVRRHRVQEGVADD